MWVEFIRTAFKALLGIAFAVIGFRAVHVMNVSDAERKRIQRKAYGDAMDAWAALRQDDYRHYKKELRKLEAAIAERDEIIEQQRTKLERWEILGQAAITGKGGKIQ